MAVLLQQKFWVFLLSYISKQTTENSYISHLSCAWWCLCKQIYHIISNYGLSLISAKLIYQCVGVNIIPRLTSTPRDMKFTFNFLLLYPTISSKHHFVTSVSFFIEDMSYLTSNSDFVNSVQCKTKETHFFYSFTINVGLHYLSSPHTLTKPRV